MARIIKKSEAKSRNVDLPPAGDERREELKRREEQLAQAAEEEAPEVGTIDPSKMQVENELAQHFNELDVSEANPDYCYCWVFTGRAGFFIKSKVSEGWEVVQGDMPEANELRGMGGDTTRRLGDVILMRIHKDRKAKLDAREREIRRRQQEGVNATLEELGDKYGRLGVKVHTNPDDRLMQTMARRAEARRVATQKFDRMLREGAVPGAEIRR